MNADNTRSLQLDEDHESPSPLRYKLPYSSSPFVRISRESQHLEAAAPGAELEREHNSANGQPGRDEELTGQNSKAKGKGKEREHRDNKEHGRSKVAASRPLSNVCHLHYFRLCTCVHRFPVKAVPPRQLAPEPNVKTNAPASSRGAAQQVPTTQRHQAAPTSVGCHQGNLTCDNERMEDSKGEASRLPKVSTTLISTIYLCLSATHEGNTTDDFNAQGT